MRIVSLLPSATDIIVALGAAEHLVGVSHSCSGDWAHLPKLTRTWLDVGASSAAIDQQVSEADQPLYQLDIETLERLTPDVVVSQSLCDVCAVPSGDVMAAIGALSSSPVLVDLAPHKLTDVPGCFAAVADAIEFNPDDLIDNWHQTLNQYEGRFADQHIRVAFLDWIDPPFIAGHWVPDMLAWLGVECVLGLSGQPSYRVTWKQIAAESPDLVVAACCGFDAARAAGELCDRELAVVYLDGHELFSRPSPALLPSLVQLASTIEQYALRGR